MNRPANYVASSSVVPSAEMAPMAYVALGANLGQPDTTIRSAIQALSLISGTHLKATSSRYRTAPVGLKHQPDFINAVVGLEIQDSTRLTPIELLARLFTIEAYFGRQRSIPNAPRTLDLDLLLYGDHVIDTPQLTLPHPRMHQRAFVLTPLLEIAPDCRIPGYGPVATLLAACHDQAIVRLTQAD